MQIDSLTPAVENGWTADTAPEATERSLLFDAATELSGCFRRMSQLEVRLFDVTDRIIREVPLKVHGKVAKGAGGKGTATESGDLLLVPWLAARMADATPRKAVDHRLDPEGHSAYFLPLVLHDELAGWLVLFERQYHFPPPGARMDGLGERAGDAAPADRVDPAVGFLWAAVSRLGVARATPAWQPDQVPPPRPGGEPGELPPAAVAMCERLFGELADKLPFSRLSLQQILENGQRILIAGRGIPVQSVSRWLLRPVTQDPLISDIVRRREPLIIADTLDGTGHPAWQRCHETTDVRSWAAIPLMTENTVFGLITLDHERAGAFGAEHQSLLQEYAAQTAQRFEAIMAQYTVSRLRKHVEIIREIQQALGEHIAFEELLWRIVQQVATYLHCSHCTAFLRETETTGAVALVAKKSYPENSPTTDRTFRAGESVAWRVFTSGQAEMIEDVRTYGHFAPPRHQAMAGPRSLIVAPIQTGRGTLGVLCADQDEYGWFTDFDRTLLETVGRQAGIALQRAEGLATLNTINSKILLLEKGHDVPAGTDLFRELLKGIVLGAVTLTNGTTGVIYTFDEACENVTGEFAMPDFKHPQPRLNNPKGLTRRVLTSRQKLVIPRLADEPDVSQSLKDQFSSMIVLPLMRRAESDDRQILGVLFVDHKAPHEFRAEEICLLELFCTQAAIAIRNVDLLSSLKKANEVQMACILYVTHEIANPCLAAKRRLLEFLGEARTKHDDSAEKRCLELLAFIDDQIVTVDNVTSITRRHSGDFSLAISRHNLGLLAGDIKDNAAEYAASKKVAVGIDVVDDVSAEIDSVLIKKVLGNLLRNAIRHSKSGGKVVITIAQDGDSVVLSVRDSGPGIPNKLLGEIFNLHPVNQPVRPPHGRRLRLGLRLSHFLVKRHGGTIVAANNPNKQGATFTVRLPRKIPIEAAPPS